jgi:hypothetical protein
MTINLRGGRLMLKVFKMNEYDWVAANSLEEAKQWYMNECGVGKEEVDEAKEISLDETMFVEYDGNNYESTKETILFLGHKKKKMLYFPGLKKLLLLGTDLLWK